METLAIKKVFGERAYQIKISSTKSMTGHLLGGAGALEGAATALSIYHGIIPPTINLEEKPECDLDYTPGQLFLLKSERSFQFFFSSEAITAL